MNITVLRFDTLDSTNTEAIRHAQAGASEGLCIVARQQTAGRGRHGRTWVSPADAGLYLSIVLKPKLHTQWLPLITLMAGVAVHDALNNQRLMPDIKWVNDVLVNEKKISGVLAETVDTPTGIGVIVGIGINLRSDAFPEEISATATSLTAETGEPADQDRLVESLTTYLSYFYDTLLRPEGPAEIIEEWRRRSTYFSGKPVRVTQADGTFEGITDGLEPNGALRVKLADGSLRTVQAGDVERLRAA